MQRFTKWVILLIATVTLAVGGVQPVQPTTAQAATYVYVTRTGKHYFYHRHNRGLNRAKKVYRVTLSTARHRGLTLAATDYKTTMHKPKRVTYKKPAKRRIVRKVKVKTAKVAQASTSNLTKLTYHGHQVVIINHNNPKFKASTLSRRAWQKYGNLDRLNRVTAANAVLNKKLMPTAAREGLYVTPTGWHNKRTSHGYLYNRCHLIGYQLTGQNNNFRNLMTGTRSLNDPGMTKYENEVAAYLKGNSSHYVRYEVKPIFKGNDLLANGVQMEGQSIGSNAVHFNVYIFNIESGYHLNYKTGTSRVAG
ncbi:DNA/RNA non-specific endonuclease [Secundilactobacillus collinoides]|uniref:Type VII secretion system protein EssD-like domain-containing protein n=2 Tax=Secundilactobacillus collinoides TaxID=33960 RepID=A0A0R2BEF6_SECCO|nr:DNA/RNA non-specific endonuclease [Secundilactobacillus collinoides]KRM74875.1 hypothetical protein FC82_GL002818 [Secundilactobacillus collinoides DSM 20515 = JCM 1123]KZL39371.1 DNA-entry nuclease [Secundilactobacillus collinoides]